MRICLVGKHFINNIAEGHFNLAYNIYLSLKSVGAHPIVFSIEHGPTDRQVRVRRGDGIYVCKLPLPLSSVAYLSRLGDFLCGYKFRNKLKKCDIIHFLNVPAWIIAHSSILSLDSKKVVHIWYSNELINPFFGKYEDRVLNKFDEIIVTSNFLLNQYENKLKTQVRMLPPPIDGSRFKLRDKIWARRTLHLRSESTVIGYIGDLHPSRGIDILLEASENESYSLAIAVPSKRDIIKLKRLLGRYKLQYRTRIIPPTGRIEIFYNALDLIVLPFRQAYAITEPPLVVLEALSSGTPVLTTPMGSIPELVPGNPNYFLTSPDPDSLRKSIIKLVNDHSKLQEMSKRAMLISRRFDLSLVGRLLLEEYRRLHNNL